MCLNTEFPAETTLCNCCDYCRIHCICDENCEGGDIFRECCEEMCKYCMDENEDLLAAGVFK